MQFIHQPHGNTRLGNYLENHLADERWADFRAAIAFIKRSGTRHLIAALAEFDRRATVRITAGVDLFGTSREGLEDLMGAVRRGQLWVYHNPAASTFHSKIYLFKNDREADLLIGSGNLTEGGLFTNYESALAVSLVLAEQNDRALLTSVEQMRTCFIALNSPQK